MSVFSLLCRRTSSRFVVGHGHRGARGLADAAASAVATQLRLNFFVPHSVIAQDELVRQVTIPSVNGVFGVLAGHVPTVTEMQPGVVQVDPGDGGEIRDYFVSGGFAFIHSDSSADISAVEAVPLSDLDENAVAEALKDAERELSEAQDEKQKAIAQINVNVNKAMASALGLKLGS